MSGWNKVYKEIHKKTVQMKNNNQFIRSMHTSTKKLPNREMIESVRDYPS